MLAVSGMLYRLYVCQCAEIFGDKERFVVRLRKRSQTHSLDSTHAATLRNPCLYLGTQAKCPSNSHRLNAALFNEKTHNFRLSSEHSSIDS